MVATSQFSDSVELKVLRLYFGGRWMIQLQGGWGAQGCILEVSRYFDEQGWANNLRETSQASPPPIVFLNPTKTSL